jgi:hypothetical protein
MRLPILAACGTLLLVTPPARAQAAADSAAIRATALDYIEGWFQGNGERMERALHTHLAKRRVATDSTGRSRLIEMTALELVQGTRAAYGTELPAAERRSDVTILDIYGNAASVRVNAGPWVDYMHVAKWSGRWVIVNVLWENRPARP